MPKALRDFKGYKVYFWSDEGDEPVHVHISKDKPNVNRSIP